MNGGSEIKNRGNMIIDNITASNRNPIQNDKNISLIKTDSTRERCVIRKRNLKNAKKIAPAINSINQTKAFGGKILPIFDFVIMLHPNIYKR